jgi:uncharacterized Tic20 family protein
MLNIVFLPFKPLRSHGFLPLISSFTLILRLSLKSYVFGSFQFQSSFYASFLDHLGDASSFCFYFLYPITLIRFIILIDLSRQRINIINKDNKVKLKFKCLKFFNHPLSITILTMPILFILILVSGVFLSFPVGFQSLLSIFYILIGIVVILIYFGCIMFDLSSTVWKIIFDLRVGNLKFSLKLPLHILRKLLTEDRFYFRIQFYILIPFSFLFLMLSGNKDTGSFNLFTFSV